MESTTVYTHYKRPPKKMEKNSGEKLVETAGYIPAKLQVEMLIQAGKRTDLWKQEHFDYGPDGVIDFDNISLLTRDKGVDMAEISMAQKEVEGRLKQQKESYDTRMKLYNEEQQEDSSNEEPPQQEST